MEKVRRLDRFGPLTLLLMFIGLSCPLKAADVSLYAIYKRQVFAQTNAGKPVPHCCPFIFDAVVELIYSNSVPGATVTFSTNIPAQLTLSYEDEFLPRRWIFWTCGTFACQQALDSAWPNGEYMFSVFGVHDGLMNPVLALSGDSYPTNAPHIANYEQTQAVDTSKDFVLKWDAFADGTTNDFCFVSVTKVLGEVPVLTTSFLEETNKLDRTATSLVIPAGSLAPGEQYDVYLRFDKVVLRDARAYPGVIGHAGYASGTHLTLRTEAAAIKP